jgi:hypothetical protein
MLENLLQEPRFFRTRSPHDIFESLQLKSLDMVVLKSTSSHFPYFLQSAPWYALPHLELYVFPVDVIKAITGRVPQLKSLRLSFNGRSSFDEVIMKDFLRQSNVWK